MVIEPSMCMFEELMNKTLNVKSYNGGDQGFLDEVFTWWHRLPTKVYYLKSFEVNNNNNNEIILEDLYVMHYLGLKPWMC
jgi:glycogenin glucosyltransferase